MSNDKLNAAFEAAILGETTMFFVREKATGKMASLPTPKKVALFMLGRDINDYEVFVAQNVAWPNRNFNHIVAKLDEAQRKLAGLEQEATS